jgi:hypothetical protein
MTADTRPRAVVATAVVATAVACRLAGGSRWRVLLWWSSMAGLVLAAVRFGGLLSQGRSAGSLVVRADGAPLSRRSFRRLARWQCRSDSFRLAAAGPLGRAAWQGRCGGSGRRSAQLAAGSAVRSGGGPFRQGRCGRVVAAGPFARAVCQGRRGGFGRGVRSAGGHFGGSLRWRFRSGKGRCGRSFPACSGDALQGSFPRPAGDFCSGGPLRQSTPTVGVAAASGFLPGAGRGQTEVLPRKPDRGE